MLTAVAVIVGLVLSRDAAPVELLLVVPLLACAIGRRHAYHTRMRMEIRSYIGTRLWPRLAVWVDEPELPSWVDDHARQLASESRPGPRGMVALVRPGLLSGQGMFVVPSAGALIAVLGSLLVGGRGDLMVFFPLWTAGLFAVLDNVAVGRSLNWSTDYWRRRTGEAVMR